MDSQVWIWEGSRWDIKGNNFYSEGLRWQCDQEREAGACFLGGTRADR